MIFLTFQEAIDVLLNNSFFWLYIISIIIVSIMTLKMENTPINTISINETKHINTDKKKISKTFFGILIIVLFLFFELDDFKYNEKTLSFIISIPIIYIFHILIYLLLKFSINQEKYMENYKLDIRINYDFTLIHLILSPILSVYYIVLACIKK